MLLPLLHAFRQILMAVLLAVLQATMTLHVEGAVGDHKTVELRGHRPESSLIFSQKLLDIGAIPVGAPQKATATIRNVGESDAIECT